jgi:hypothetical protein
MSPMGEHGADDANLVTVTDRYNELYSTSFIGHCVDHSIGNGGQVHGGLPSCAIESKKEDVARSQSEQHVTDVSELHGRVLIRDPGLAESRYPASAIQSHSVHAGQQSGYIPFEPCYLDMQHAWPTASLQPLLQVF